MARSRSTIFKRWVPRWYRSPLSVSRASPRGAIASSIRSKTVVFGSGPIMRAIPHILRPFLPTLAVGQLGVVGDLQLITRMRDYAQMPHLTLIDDIELARLLPFDQ